MLCDARFEVLFSPRAEWLSLRLDEELRPIEEWLDELPVYWLCPWGLLPPGLLRPSSRRSSRSSSEFLVVCLIMVRFNVKTFVGDALRKRSVPFGNSVRLTGRIDDASCHPFKQNTYHKYLQRIFPQPNEPSHRRPPTFRDGYSGKRQNSKSRTTAALTHPGEECLLQDFMLTGPSGPGSFPEVLPKDRHASGKAVSGPHSHLSSASNNNFLLTGFTR